MMREVKSKKMPVAGAREFFSNELRAVMQRQNLVAAPDSIEYVTDLLLRYIKSEVFFVKTSSGKLENNVLADLYVHYLEGTEETKRLTLRRLGDICLLISGFFSDSLNRKVVDIDYYHGMGGSAYLTLSQFPPTALRPLYSELGSKFKPFSDVLGEMSERSGLQTNSDLLRLYERWLMTGSERLRSLLSENGIAGIPLETKVKH